MSDWVRKRTCIAGEYGVDDWVIVFRGEDIGRVVRERYPVNGFPPWRWHLWTRPTANGMTNTLEEALEAIRGAYLRGHGSGVE